jgi:tetratricopeptide (TPR) repeat protein
VNEKYHIDMTVETVVSQYYERVLLFPECKDDPLQVGTLAEEVTPDFLSQEFERLSRRSTDVFHLFAIIKTVFTTFLLHANDIGAFSDCVRISDVFLERATASSAPLCHEGISILLSRAKALRSMGRFEEAFESYRQAIRVASVENLSLEVSRCLLLIGKLYGNYLGQKSLFSSFVEEASARFHKELRCSEDAEREKMVIGYLAICEDASGQAYRDSEPQKAERHFLEAIKYNEQIQWESGISRSTCHLHYFRFQQAKTETAREVCLLEFEKGLRLLQRHDLEERGLGIRWLQFAEMLRVQGYVEKAEECLTLSKGIATQYSDYRTLVRILIAESALLAEAQPQSALYPLERGRRIAVDRRLLLHECEINRCMAALLSRTGSDQDRSFDLFDRNRQLLLHLLDQVKAGLQTFDMAPEEKPEFHLVSKSTRKQFREKLVLDLEHAVHQLDLSVQAVTVALRMTEMRRHELLVLGVVNAMARELLHDLKYAIPTENNANIFQVPSSAIHGVAIRLHEIAESGEVVQTVEIHDLAAILEDFSCQIEELGKRMSRLKVLLAAKLRRPRALDTWVSLRSAAVQAIEEIQLLDSAAGPLLSASFNCDIKVISDEQLMVTVIRNLLTNALETCRQHVNAGGKVELCLSSKRVGDPQVGNPARAALLTVRTWFGSATAAAEAAKSIRLGLEGQASDKPLGSGVGMDIATTVLCDLMGAQLGAVETSTSAGVEASFTTASGRAELVEDAIVGD